MNEWEKPFRFQAQVYAVPGLRFVFIVDPHKDGWPLVEDLVWRAEVKGTGVEWQQQTKRGGER